MFGFFKRMMGQGDVSSDNAPAPLDDAPVIAFVALPRDVALRADAVARQLRDVYRVPATVDPGGDPDAPAVISVGGTMVGLTVIPKPIPWSDLEGPCACAWHWPEATDVMRGHRAHVIVAVLGPGAGGPVERSLLATRAAAAVAATHGATGVYWGNGTTVNPADRFIEKARGASVAKPPVLLWVEARYARRGDGSAVAFTTGMAPLGHKEFEVPATRREPGYVLEMLLDACLYVLANGPILKHGQTFGRTADERLKIRHGPSMHEGRGSVITLGM
jgi:hypothetical protein